MKIYNYCQFDSIQQCALQTHLQLLQQLIQVSELTHLPLFNCVFYAISQKVESIVVDYYYERDFVYCDLNNPFTKGFNITKKQAKALDIDRLA